MEAPVWLQWIAVTVTGAEPSTELILEDGVGGKKLLDFDGASKGTKKIDFLPGEGLRLSGNTLLNMTNEGAVGATVTASGEYVVRPDIRLARITEVLDEARGEPLTESVPTTEIMWGHSVRLNKHGRRGPEVSETTAPGTVRITMHGGSFVFGIGVPEGATIGRLLQEKLKASSEGTEREYEVVNLGDAGAGITTVLRIFVREGIRLKPDIAIAISAYNNYRLFSSKDERSVLWHLSKGLYSTSLFYATLREKLALIIYKDNNVGIYNQEVAIPRENVPSALNYYKAALEQLAILSQDNGIRLVFGLQPVFIPAGYEDLQELANEGQMSVIENALERGAPLTYYEAIYYMHSLQIRAMIEVAEKYAVPVFDLTKSMPVDKYKYYIDQIHPNAQGTRIIADALYAHLRSGSFSAISPK